MWLGNVILILRCVSGCLACAAGNNLEVLGTSSVRKIRSLELFVDISLFALPFLSTLKTVADHVRLFPTLSPIIMSSARVMLRASRLALRSNIRPFSTTPSRFAVPLSERGNDTADEYRRYMKEKPLNPHMTNTTSTIANEMPSIGEDGPPPELITSVDPNYTPKDSVPENTEKMTGGTQAGSPKSGPNAELEVGEIEGIEFKVEPLRRTGEDANTMRARLLCKPRSNEKARLLTTDAFLNNRPKPEKGHTRIRSPPLHLR